MVDAGPVSTYGEDAPTRTDAHCAPRPSAPKRYCAVAGENVAVTVKVSVELIDIGVNDSVHESILGYEPDGAIDGSGAFAVAGWATAIGTVRPAARRTVTTTFRSRRVEKPEVNRPTYLPLSSRIPQRPQASSPHQMIGPVAPVARPSARTPFATMSLEMSFHNRRSR